VTFAPGDNDFLPKSQDVPANVFAANLTIPLSAPSGLALISWYVSSSIDISGTELNVAKGPALGLGWHRAR